MPDQPRPFDAAPHGDLKRLRRAPEGVGRGLASEGAPLRPKGFSQRNARAGSSHPSGRRTEPTARLAADAVRRSGERTRREAAAALDISPDMIIADAPLRPTRRRVRSASAFAPERAVAARSATNTSRTWIAGPILIVAAALAAALIPAREEIPGRDAPLTVADFQTSPIATASYSTFDPPERAAAPAADRYLDAAFLTALIAERPIKCLPSEDELAGACRETVRYDGAFSVYTRRSVLDPEAGVALEINGAFGVIGDAICHRTDGASALVVGLGADAPPARSMERIVNAALQASGPAPVCHRLRRGPNGTFVADAYIDGAYRADMSDPRPFRMIAEAL